MLKYSTIFILGGLIYIFLLIYDDCDRMRPTLKEAGIVVTFDDSSINEWFYILPLLDSFNMKATFFLTDIATIDKKDIIKLRIIQESGHEIASHGYAHIDPILSIKEKGVLTYIKSEILPAKDFLTRYGFHQESFAFVYGIRNKKLEKELGSIFSNIRGVSETQRHKMIKRIQDVKDIYFDRESQQIVRGFCIDEIQEVNIEQITYILKKIKRENKIIVFYAHTPRENVSTGKWEVKIDFLKEIFKIANEMKIKSYRFRDINHV
jgi:peptidoglycan-N-acetylglucosamine deacetylase